VAVTEKAFRAGNASATQCLQAKQALATAELELCETEKDRLSVLRRIVEQAKDYEKLVRASVESGNASASSTLDAKLARINAEIALERANTKPVVPASTR
jgi:outer membrane protein TolC